MSRYVEVPADALRAALIVAGFRVLDEYRSEEVYAIRHARDNRYAVKVYSSIARGKAAARACGADAIRVVATFDIIRDGRVQRTVGVFKAQRVYRTGSVEAVVARMLERMREAYGFINEKLKKERTA